MLGLNHSYPTCPSDDNAYVFYAQSDDFAAPFSDSPYFLDATIYGVPTASNSFGSQPYAVPHTYYARSGPVLSDCESPDSYYVQDMSVCEPAALGASDMYHPWSSMDVARLSGTDFSHYANSSSPPALSPHLSPSDNSAPSSNENTPSPLHLNEFCNVFDHEFSKALSSEQLSSILPPPRSFLSSSSPITLTLPRQRTPTGAVSHSPRNVSATIPGEASSHQDTEQSKRRFPCLIPGCGRRFTSQYTLKVHMEAHKPKPRITFPCTLGCPERFSRQHDRLRHEVAKHGKICEFSCEDCGRFFSSGKTLGNHKCPVARPGTRWVNN